MEGSLLVFVFVFFSMFIFVLFFSRHSFKTERPKNPITTLHPTPLRRFLYKPTLASL